MPPTDVNERIAREVMGWEVYDSAACKGRAWGIPHPIHGHVLQCAFSDFDPEHSLDACALAEKRIGDLGLMRTYKIELISPLMANSKNVAEGLILLTPAQRCAAMLAAIGGGHA